MTTRFPPGLAPGQRIEFVRPCCHAPVCEAERHIDGTIVLVTDHHLVVDIGQPGFVLTVIAEQFVRILNPVPAVRQLAW